jgi:vacuolar-type H+-ATPase subunit E/Vma4
MSINNSVATRMDELISLVEAGRNEKQQDILIKARAEAENILKRAYRDARLQVKDAVVQERRLFAEAENTATARRETEQRRQRLQESEALLEQGRIELKKALLERWQNPESRKSWLNMVVLQAIDFLPDGDWEIVCSEEVEKGYMKEIKSHINKKRSCTVHFKTKTKLGAGVKIGSMQAWVDGSLETLLADTNSIDAQLLGLIASAGKPS